MLVAASILKSVFTRRDVNVFLGFMRLPMLIPFLVQSMRSVQFEETQSFLSFVDLVLSAQYKIVLPMIVFSLIVVSVFKEEIDSGILMLYKDINRNIIYRAKVFSLMVVYLIYLLGTLVLAAFAYYIIYLLSGDSRFVFMPRPGELTVIVRSILVTLLLNLITIMMLAMMSITSGTLITVLTGIFFSLLATVSPLLKGINYLFSNGYISGDNSNTALSFLGVMVVSLIYLSIFYIRGRILFNKVEF